jgi:hypothetical protein
MKKLIKKVFRLWWSMAPRRERYQQRNDHDLVRAKRIVNPLFLERYGYKVYSQNDEDGIIAEIFNRIGTSSKTFVEFGVQDGLECNSHFLLHKGWSGLWIEGSEKYCKMIKTNFSEPIASGQLHLVNAFIDRTNINHLISTTPPHNTNIWDCRGVGVGG